MLDWLGALSVSSQNERRIELALTPATRWTGWALLLAGAVLLPLAWSWSHLLALAPAAVGGFGALLASVRRRLIFDADDGLLRLEHRVLGIRSRWAVPLFHLRRIVIAAERGHHVAYIERRTGGRIRLDESRQYARVLAVAKAVCAVTELRLHIDVNEA